MKKINISDLIPVFIFDYFDMPLFFISRDESNLKSYLFYLIDDDIFFVSEINRKTLTLLFDGGTTRNFLDDLIKNNQLFVLFVDGENYEVKSIQEAESNLGESYEEWLPEEQLYIEHDYVTGREMKSLEKTYTEFFPEIYNNEDASIQTIDKMNYNAIFIEDINQEDELEGSNEINLNMSKLSNSGKSRRKKDAMKAFRDLINPIKKRSHVAYQTFVDGLEIANASYIGYSSKKKSVNKSNELEGKAIREPRFIEKFPQNLSEKDSWKNLRTTAEIKSINITDTDRVKAEIKAELSDVNLTFVLPEEFFLNDNQQNIVEGLTESLMIINNYVKSNSSALYLTTMCQSKKLDLNNIELYIADPDFMAFQTIDKDFDELRSVTVAITTGVI